MSNPRFRETPLRFLLRPEDRPPRDRDLPGRVEPDAGTSADEAVEGHHVLVGATAGPARRESDFVSEWWLVDSAPEPKRAEPDRSGGFVCEWWPPG